jgi:CheY-like chemotaxis protein
MAGKRPLEISLFVWTRTGLFPDVLWKQPWYDRNALRVETAAPAEGAEINIMPAVFATETKQCDGILLIVARSNTWRDSLTALLKAMPQTHVLDPVEDCSTALHVVPKHQPAVVLVDINILDDETSTLLSQLKIDRPLARCLVFVDSYKRQVEARDAGADAVLLKGFTTPELFSTVNELLMQPASASAR